jgi:hypothetical protein
MPIGNQSLQSANSDPHQQSSITASEEEGKSKPESPFKANSIQIKENKI